MQIAIVFRKRQFPQNHFLTAFQNVQCIKLSIATTFRVCLFLNNLVTFEILVSYLEVFSYGDHLAHSRGRYVRRSGATPTTSCFYSNTVFWVSFHTNASSLELKTFEICGPGSICALAVISGSSLLVLYSAMRGFSPGTPVFPSHQLKSNI